MKFSIITSVLIVCATAVLAIMQGQKISTLNEDSTTLKERALALGVPLEEGSVAKSTASNSGVGSKGATKGAAAASGGDPATDSSPEATAKAFAKELFEFATEMRKWRGAGSEPSADAKKKMFAFLNRFLELDPEVMPFLIDEIRANQDFEKQEKQQIIAFSFMSLSQSSPQTALNLYINSKDMLGKDQMANQVVGMSLGAWAAQDPSAALDWIETNGDKLPEDSAEGARRLAIAHAFKTEPDLAVTMALQLDRKDIMELAGGLGGVMPNAEAQLEMLRSIQGRLDELPDTVGEITPESIAAASKEQILRGGILVGLGDSLASQSFEDASTLLESANLTPVETSLVARGVADGAGEMNNPGEWLGWVDTNTPPDQREAATSQIVQRWTNSDFRATAAWIGEQPAGPLKEQATQTFAETVAPHEPDTAANWALTLPPSDERTDLLRNIHNHWQGKDQEAAAAFAAEQGLSAVTPPAPPPPPAPE